MSSLRATPLDFAFKGCSIWLELEQQANDLDKALDTAAYELDVHRVPAPHVTAIYGIDHLSESEVLTRFRECLVPRVSSWPELRVKGFKVDRSFHGVDGEDMTMAWMEVEFETSKAHEELVDVVYDAFHDGIRVRPWIPHVSIVYENPTIAKANLDYAGEFMQRFPTLTGQTFRNVKGMSVWSTRGKMEDWKCLERCEFVESAVDVDPVR